MAVKGCFELFLEEEVDPFQKIEGNQIKLQLKLQPKLCIKRGPQTNSWIDFQLKFFLQVFCCSKIVCFKQVIFWRFVATWKILFPYLKYRYTSVYACNYKIIYPSGIKNAKNAYFLVFSCAEQKDMIFMSLLKFSLNCLRWSHSLFVNIVDSQKNNENSIAV